MTALPVGRLLALVLPILAVGLFARALYTPDEPREASLVVSMAAQPNKSLPALAGYSFAEKPPLLYWAGAASVGLTGSSPPSLRLPNLLYALAAVLALGALGARAAGATAGFATSLCAATALQSYQAMIWLATDAPLLAGVAVAMFGAFSGLTASERRPRLAGYLTMHAGLLVAFFAKGPAGWLVPGAAFVTVLVAEQRPRELLRAELWAGVPVLGLVIGAWVWWVDQGPDGAEQLRVLFWYNLVGRVLHLDAPTALDYSSGHQNSFGKYLLEWPMYLLPWTALAVAALRRVPRAFSAQGAEGTAWRLAAGAVAIPTLLLSFAATARGVYYAPVLLGFALGIGLYAGRAGAALDRFERGCWRATGLLVALLALLLSLVVALLCFAPALRTVGSVALGAVALASAALAAWLALTPPVAAAGGLPRLALAVTLILTLVVGPAYGQLNKVLSLETLAARIRAAAGPGFLIVAEPDETTVAMFELYFPERANSVMLVPNYPLVGCVLQADVAFHGLGTRVVTGVRDAPRWGLAAWLEYLGYRRASAAPVVAAAVPADWLRVAARVERPGGRAFVVLAPTSVPPAPPTPCS